MKKVLATVLLGASVTLFGGMATASAAQVKPVTIQFNGGVLSSDVDPVIKNGRTLVPLRLISEALGADVQWDGATKSITIVKNSDTIKLAINQKATTKNGQPAVELEVPAEMIGGRTMVPVRFVSEVLGAKVEWDNANRMVVIQHEEKRNGLSPEELLAKSTAEMQKQDTYRMSGELTMNVKVKDPSGAVPPQPISFGMSMDGNLKQSTSQFSFSGQANVLGEKIGGEMYFDGTNMYQKAEGEEWVKLPNAVDPELLAQMKNQDPAVAAEMMKEIGMIPVFGNDAVVNNKEYYVIRVKVDPAKFSAFMEKMMKQGVTPTAQDEQVLEALKAMKMDLTEKVYINKETFVSEITEINATVKMNVQGAQIDMDMTGEMRVSDLGKAVTFPVIPANVKTLE